MGFLSFMQNVSDFLLTPVLEPLLSIPPLLAILIVAAFISLVSILFQKHFTNQKRLKQIKKELKKKQEELKKHKDDPEKQMKLQKKMMPMQGEMMRESLKPTLWTMIPFLLLFLWLSGHFAYLPLAPNEPFTITAYTDDLSNITLEAPEGVQFLSEPQAEVVDGVARWDLTAKTGHYSLSLLSGDLVVTHPVLVTHEKEYLPPEVAYSGAIKKIEVSNAPLKPLGSFTIFGWQPGWIFVYIIFSLVFSISLRKIMDVA